MKHCSKCSLDKPESAFGINRKRYDGLQGICKSCRNGYLKEWYGRNQSLHKARVRVTDRKRRRVLQERMLQYLTDHPCVDCGEPDVVVLQFDHVRGNKSANIAKMLRKRQSWDTILEEIEKCEVRCANCHARRTAKQFGWYRLARGVTVARLALDQKALGSNPSGPVGRLMLKRKNDRLESSH